MSLQPTAGKQLLMRALKGAGMTHLIPHSSMQRGQSLKKTADTGAGMTASHPHPAGTEMPRQPGLSALSIGGTCQSVTEESLTGMLRTAETSTGGKGALTTTGETLQQGMPM